MRATKAYPGHTHRTRDTADGTRAAWRQSVAARLSQKSNRSQDRQRAAGDPDRQSDRRFHICAHMFVCTSVCVRVCLHRHVRESSDAFLLDFGTVYLPDAEQAPFCCPWTWD